MHTVPFACITAYTRVTRVPYTQFTCIFHAFNARVTRVTRVTHYKSLSACNEDKTLTVQRIFVAKNGLLKTDILL